MGLSSPLRRRNAILGWATGATLLLAGLLPTAGPALAAPEASEARLSEVWAEVRSVSSKLEAFFLQETRDLRSTAQRIAAGPLPALVSRWESEFQEGSGELEALHDEVVEALSQHSEADDLDFLFLVTQDGEVFTGQEPSAAAAPSSEVALRNALVVLTASAFRTGQASQGFEELAVSGGEAAGDEVFAISVSPVAVRADVPYAALVAGVALERLLDDVDDLVDRSVVELRWHLFTRLPQGGAVVALGVDEGSMLDPALVEELQANSSSEGFGLAGEESPTPGRWFALGSVDGRVRHGLGVTAEPEFVTSLLAVRGTAEPGAGSSEPTSGRAASGASPSQPTYLAERPTTPRRSRGQGAVQASSDSSSSLPTFEFGDGDSATRLVLYCVIATVVGGGLWLVLAAWFSRRRRRRQVEQLTAATTTTTVSAPNPPPQSAPRVPTSPTAVGEDLVAQFEINWKTFASYTQDVLEEKLRSLEELPQQSLVELQESMEKLSDEMAHLRVAPGGDVNPATPQGLEELREAVQVLSKELVAVRSEGGAVVAPTLVDGASVAGFDSMRETMLQLGADVGDLQGEMSGLQGGLRSIEEGLRGATHGLLERIGELVEVGASSSSSSEGLSADAALMVADVRGGVITASERLTELNNVVVELSDVFGRRQDEIVGNRVTEKLAGIQAQFDQRVEDMQAAREALVQEAGVVRDELEESRRLEAELRRQIDAASAREKSLQATVESEKAGREAALLQRDEVRDQENQLRTEQRGLQARVEEETRKVREGETAIESLRADVARRDQDVESLRSERDAADERGRQVRVEKDQELEAQKKSYEEAALELDERCRELERARSEAVNEAERLVVANEQRDQELEARSRAFEALKDEKEHLDGKVRAGEDGVREVEGRLARMKDEKRDTERQLADREEQLGASRRDVERLEGELVSKARQLEEVQSGVEALRADLDTERSAERAQTARLEAEKADFEARSRHQSAELERLEESVRTRDNELRDVEAEKLRYKAQFTEIEAKWQSRVSEIELRVSEAQRSRNDTLHELDDAKRALGAAQDELALARAAVDAGGASSETVSGLEDEKRLLSKSLADLSKELERVRDEAEQVRRFHGTLMDGSLPTAVVGVDGACRVFSWNARATELWGKSSSAVVGEALGELGVAGLEDAVLVGVRQIISTGKPVELPDLSFADPDGQAKHLRLRGDPILGPDGEALGAVVLAEDVSEKTEKDMESRLQSIFNERLVRSLPAALIVLDSRDRVISWNHHAEKVLAVAGPSAIGSELFTLDSPLSRPAFKKRFEQNKGAGVPAKVRVKLDVQGVPGQYLFTQCPFVGEDDSVRGTVVLLQEVTVPVEAGGK